MPWVRCNNHEILEVFRGPLKGLAHLHAKGYMHRDVIVKNMFVISLNPTQAVLGDFGKALRAETDQNIWIGPAATRAPEVNGRIQYDNKIDVWSMGWALVWALKPDLFPEKDQPFILHAWYSRVMEVVTLTLEEGGWHAKLAELLAGMLALDPAKRISAAQALMQVYSLLTSPPQEMYGPSPQGSSQQMPSSKHVAFVSDLSQRDSQVEPGECPFTIKEQLQKESTATDNKKPRLQ